MDNNFDFNSLNESYGSIFFNDKIFRKNIESIVDKMRNSLNDNYKIIKINKDHSLKFYILTVHLNFSWLKNLKIYYTFDTDFKKYLQAEALAPSFKDENDKWYHTYCKDIIKNDTPYLLEAPIFIYLNFIDSNEFYYGILYHEIGHLFDILYKHPHINNADILYAFKHSNSNISTNILYDEIKSYNFDNEIINEFIYKLMYYCNISELHAFNEQTYFQVLNACCEPKILYKNIKDNYNEKIKYSGNLVKYCSDEINDIFDLRNGCKILIDNIDKIEIDDIKTIASLYNLNSNKFALLTYFYNQINHLYTNISKNFNYFYKIFDTKEKLSHYSITESFISGGWSIHFNSPRGHWVFDKENNKLYFE